MSVAAAPLDPPWVIKGAVRVGNADGLQEDHKIVIGVGQAEDLAVVLWYSSR
ncbi:hypothetical protein [Streptomyces sp. NPDC001930]|uniref:hypothetical protein n=1 Tax=Streptomyces sp. NPDC001930 TaxID=3364625 RepID=UPI0036B15962